MASLTLMSTAFSATVVSEDFGGPPWAATGSMPLEVQGKPWRLMGFDRFDESMHYRAGDAAGGLQMQRGTPWGLPGAFLTYVGDDANDVQTIVSVIELSGGPGDHNGRQTWLAAFSASPQEPTGHLALAFDTPGTNGAQTGQGGPGGWSGQTLTGGLKLVSSRGLLPERVISGRAAECYPQEYVLLLDDPPVIGHVYEAILSYDRFSGGVASRVRDRTEDVTLWEGRFRIKPCPDPLWPVVGGFNGFAPWASDKGFALRVLSIGLDSTYRPVGRERAHPGMPPGHLLAQVPGVVRAPWLRDFCGAVNVPGGGLWHELGVGWGRQDFSWGEIEPQQGVWRFEPYDNMVMSVHLQGQEILPMLGYTAPWAARSQGEGFGGPRDVADWEDFVETVVSRYSRPPFNLRYFQVWNEPTRKAGFWKGDSDEEFFERIYLPAARIIRRYGCQVVFGGWPCSDGVQRLCELLDRYEAWHWTDILDLHYYELQDMVTLYERYVRTGKCRGVWQTEVGYHPFEEYLPNLYCRTLYWGLTQGWEFADQFKLFWYAFWGAGPDADNCLTRPGAQGNEPSSTHGVRLKTLNRVLGDAQLAAFDAYSCDPPLPFSTDEETESSQGFRCGSRTVIAFQVSPHTQQAYGKLRLRIDLPAAPQRVTRWDSTGDQRPLAGDYGDGTLVVTVPLDDMLARTARNWGRRVDYAVGYVVVD